ncbi:hypothetical protein [Neptunicella marina]|uniref:Uncharacterized protein n=1 Tax=Neptunicella marina TaxID=2125989 RepID=A0A8J6IVR4_9ALTE|nr:hypothetical protein [Neptunicella marina]MBC3766466.1 hypothetical protein [Neptunicella marina]
MQNLLSLIEKEFDEAEGWIRIVDANWYSNDLRLDVSISMHDESQPELWEISCDQVVEESINSTGTETIMLSSKSPLLIPYSDIQFDLMFSDNFCDPEALLGIVLSCCIEVFSRAEYIHRFLNQSPELKGIVSSKYGKLGRFPESLAIKIMKALEAKPIRINALDQGVPKKWNGSEFVSYSQNLQVLELGTSYIIGERFSAERA